MRPNMPVAHLASLVHPRGALVLALLVGSVLAQGCGERATTVERDRASLAVMDFTFQITNAAAGHAEFDSRILTDKFITALARMEKFRLVERGRIADIEREFDMAKRGLTSRATAVKAGQMIGADFLVLGSIHEMGVRSRSERVAYTDRVAQITEATVAGDIRVIDARTGEIVAAFTQVANSPSGGDQANPESALDATQRSFAARMAEQVVDAVYPIRIVNVAPEGKLWLDRGDGSGLAVGELLDVFVAERAASGAGDSLGSSPSKIGTARVVRADGRMTEAVLVRSERPVGVGEIVRRQLAVDEASPPRPASSRVTW